MVKLKRRYLLVEILFDDKSVGNITDTDIYHAVFDKIAIIHGDYGIGAIQTSFQVKVCDVLTNIAVLRISVESRHILCSSLPFVISIGSILCTLKTIYEGSSMRTIERRLIKINLELLYAQLRSATSLEEKSEIQNAICSITGNRVSNIQM